MVWILDPGFWATLTHGVASITDGMVNLVAARSHLETNMGRHLGARNGSSEAVLGMMAMGVPGKAWLTEIVILTVGAVKEFTFGKLCDTIFCQSRKKRWLSTTIVVVIIIIMA